MMAIMVIRTCQLVEGGLPANVKLKMYLNIILDFVVGLVPVLGDIGDDRGGALAAGGDGAEGPRSCPAARPHTVAKSPLLRRRLFYMV